MPEHKLKGRFNKLTIFFFSSKIIPCLTQIKIHSMLFVAWEYQDKFLVNLIVSIFLIKPKALNYHKNLILNT